MSGDIQYYKFNVNVGDVVPAWNSIDESIHHLRVESIDSVTLGNGKRRKRIRFEDGRDIWIEGAGSVLYPLDLPLSNLEYDHFPCRNLLQR